MQEMERNNNQGERDSPHKEPPQLWPWRLYVHGERPQGQPHQVCAQFTTIRIEQEELPTSDKSHKRR